MARSHRVKGARGEREFRDVLRMHGFQAERTGRGVKNTKDDLAHDAFGFHFEVKRRNRFEPVAWLRQAREDANGRIPVAVWKRNNGEWMAIMGADELLEFIADYRSLLPALEKERGAVAPQSPPLDNNDSIQLSDWEGEGGYAG